MIKVSPSILAADFADLKSEIMRVKQADFLHLDVMDGQFVPNISIGIPVVASIRKSTDMILDVHLMIQDPERYIEAFAQVGADIICVHYEATQHLQQVIEGIKGTSAKVGVALKPQTPVSVLFDYLDQLDMVLVMTVEPGFGGQKFMPEMLSKVRMLYDRVQEKKICLDIQVDGGVNQTTAKWAVDAGANILVVGQAMFLSDHPAQEIQTLQRLSPTDLL